MNGSRVSTVTAYTAHREWATRPPDERYTSVNTLFEAARARRARIEEYAIETIALRTEAVASDALALRDASGRQSGLTHWSFEQLAGIAGAPPKYLRTLPAAIASDAINYGLCEVLVTFMYEEINRFLAQGQQGENFDVFFGTPRWRECNSIADPQKRNRFLHDLYLEQLRTTARVKYVRSFEMRNGRDVTDYFLFYGTKNLKGLQKMKEAMWKVDSGGEFTFSDATDPNQMVLFGEPAVDVLQRQIVERFSGRDTTVGEVEEFVLAETAFRETHYKRILKGLELGSVQALSVVNPPPGRRAGTYARPELVLRFAPR